MGKQDTSRALNNHQHLITISGKKMLETDKIHFPVLYDFKI